MGAESGRGTWTVERAIPTFAVPALEVGIAFYARLGFEVDWRWPEERPTHAGLLLGGCAIMLAECEPAERADVYFLVDDVDACHAALMDARPWELAHEAGRLAERDDCPPRRALQPPPAPTVTGYGLRDFALVDPWGHHLAFGEVVHEGEPA